jgi:hypothetical protein
VIPSIYVIVGFSALTFGLSDRIKLQKKLTTLIPNFKSDSLSNALSDLIKDKYFINYIFSNMGKIYEKQKKEFLTDIKEEFAKKGNNLNKDTVDAILRKYKFGIREQFLAARNPRTKKLQGGYRKTNYKLSKKIKNFKKIYI